jgi:hypothetical protein
MIAEHSAPQQSVTVHLYNAVTALREVPFANSRDEMGLIPNLRLSDRLLPSRVARWT